MSPASLLSFMRFFSERRAASIESLICFADAFMCGGVVSAAAWAASRKETAEPGSTTPV